MKIGKDFGAFKLKLDDDYPDYTVKLAWAWSKAWRYERDLLGRAIMGVEKQIKEYP